MKRFMGAFLLFAVMALSSHATAGRFWSDDPVTNGLIVSSNVLLLLDWGQTQYGSDRPDEFEETGFARHFTGAHPTTREVNQYNGAVLILMNTAGYFLPEEAYFFGWRWNPKKSLYFGVATVEGVTVYENYQAGVKFDL